MTDTSPIHGGQRSADPSKCPPSQRIGVRHALGMLSAIISESRPSWAGARSDHDSDPLTRKERGDRSYWLAMDQAHLHALVSGGSVFAAGCLS